MYLVLNRGGPVGAGRLRHRDARLGAQPPTVRFFFCDNDRKANPGIVVLRRLLDGVLGAERQQDLVRSNAVVGPLGGTSNVVRQLVFLGSQKSGFQ